MLGVLFVAEHLVVRAVEAPEVLDGVRAESADELARPAVAAVLDHRGAGEGGQEGL